MSSLWEWIFGKTPTPGQTYEDTSGKILSGYETTVKSGENVIITGEKELGSTARLGIETAGNFGIDTERSITKGLVNIVGDAAHSARYVAKNGIGLLDNIQDQFFQLIQDIRGDITNTFQVIILLSAIGIAAGVILFGDKILDRGIKTAGIEIA